MQTVFNNRDSIPSGPLPTPHLKPPAGSELSSQQGKAGWGEPPGDSSSRALSWAAVGSRQGGLCRGGPFRGGD